MQSLISIRLLPIINEKYFNGTATIFYDPDILNEIVASMGTEKIIIVPVDVHQVYCVPYKKHGELQDCQNVFEKYLSTIDKEELLTETVLLYDSTNKIIMEMNGVSYGLELSDMANRKVQHKR